MAGDDNMASPEREQTDESLRVERENTDRALAEKQQAVEEDADTVVELARENADAVLIAARDKADALLEETEPDTAPLAVVTEERSREDEVLRDERAAADESVRREREETARALTRLLPLERDATDRYLLTERDRSDHALSTRDDFLGIVSHDLRDLLGGILMSASVLSNSASEDDKGKLIVRETKRIQRHASRMNRLIGDLVDVASIDAGKLGLTPSRNDAAAVIAEAVDTFRVAASAQDICLEATAVERPMLADFDHDRILQVLANLITNAMKFTSPGGRITVGAEHNGDDIRFSVRDTGSGIPVDMLEAVFERFVQVSGNQRRGLGLGLYISKCIIEAHGGKIWAESIQGSGSQFFFSVGAST